MGAPPAKRGKRRKKKYIRGTMDVGSVYGDRQTDMLTRDDQCYHHCTSNLGFVYGKSLTLYKISKLLPKHIHMYTSYPLFNCYN